MTRRDCFGDRWRRSATDLRLFRYSTRPEHRYWHHAPACVRSGSGFAFNGGTKPTPGQFVLYRDVTVSANLRPGCSRILVRDHQVGLVVSRRPPSCVLEYARHALPGGA